MHGISNPILGGPHIWCINFFCITEAFLPSALARRLRGLWLSAPELELELEGYCGPLQGIYIYSYRQPGVFRIQWNS